MSRPRPSCITVGHHHARKHVCSEWSLCGTSQCVCSHASGSHRPWGDYCVAECRYCDCPRYSGDADMSGHS